MKHDEPSASFAAGDWFKAGGTGRFLQHGGLTSEKDFGYIANYGYASANTTLTTPCRKLD